jgi:23S rRNA (cytosine1962-C5)-methyltransferase
MPRQSRKHTPKPRRRESRFPLDESYLLPRPLVDESPFPIVRLKSTTRHPTVFRKRIAEVDGQLRHGDLAQVVSDSGDVIGYGTWNPRAEATVRIIRWGQTPPDQRWWDDRLEQAVRLRTEVLGMLRAGRSTACRLVNAEGDGLPGLTADLFADVLCVQAFTLGMYQRAEAIARRLADLAGAKQWLVGTGPSTLEQEGFLAEGISSGSVPRTVVIQEHGLRYEVHPAEGHKTGFFCDQRENRLRLREFCAGKSVLDLCCYSGGFSLNAMQAGAASVTGVDLDEEAVASARRNAQLNGASIRFVHADAFAYMRDMQRNGQRFDVIVLDPPKLIRQRSEDREGRNKYFDLNQLAASLVAPGGLLVTCSCSGLLSMEDFTLTVRAATAERNPQLLHRTGGGADHPVALNCLETEYLKCLWLHVP